MNDLIYASFILYVNVYTGLKFKFLKQFTFENRDKYLQPKTIPFNHNSSENTIDKNLWHAM